MIGGTLGDVLSFEDVSFGATPLASIPLASIAMGTTPLASIPLASTLVPPASDANVSQSGAPCSVTLPARTDATWWKPTGPA